MRALKLCIALVFVHHVACTGLYLFMPTKPTLVRKYVISYMKPAFLQFWELFAEPPREYQKIIVRCRKNGAWGDWIDPVAPLLDRFQGLRLRDSGKELFTHLSFIYFELRTIKREQKRSGCGLQGFDQPNCDFKKNAAGLIAYAHRICGSDIATEAVTLKLVTLGSVDFAERSVLPLTRIKEEIIFPEVKLEN